MGFADGDAMAADYTTVSLTPGKDETELNFAWYSEKTDAEATPVVHFGTDQDALETLHRYFRRCEPGTDRRHCLYI